MTAPWRIELDQPQRVRLHYLALPVIFVEKNDRAALVIESTRQGKKTRANYLKHFVNLIYDE